MYSRFLTFQWRLMFNAYYSPVGVTILTNVYCYGNLTGLTGNRVYFGEGKNSPNPSSSHSFQWRPDHFSGPFQWRSAFSRLVIAIRAKTLSCYNSILHIFCIFIAFTWSRDLHVLSIRIAYFTVFQ